MRNQAAGKVPAGFHHREPGIDSGRIHNDVLGNPKLSTRRSIQTNSHRLVSGIAMCSALFSSFAAARACFSSSACSGPQQDVGVDGDFHFWPAQPAAAASWISSSVAIFLVLPASTPIKPSILPVGRAALKATRPSGNLSISIFSPGFMPRCCNTSLRKVTCVPVRGP